MKVGDLVRYKDPPKWDIFHPRDLEDGMIGVVTAAKYVNNSTVGETYMCDVWWADYGFCYEKILDSKHDRLFGKGKKKKIKKLFANKCLEAINV